MFREVEVKTCRDCHMDLPLSEFHAKRRWPDGSPRALASYCKECAKERTRVSSGLANRGRPYEARKPGQTPEQVKERRRARHNERMATDAEYRERVRAKHRATKRKAYREQRERMAADPAYAREVLKLQRRSARKLRTRRRRERAREAHRQARQRALEERQRLREEARAQRARDRQAAIDRERVRRRLDRAYSAKIMASERLDPGPFVGFVNAHFANSEEAGEKLGISARYVRDHLHGKYEHISIRVVDRALTNYGRPDLLNDLYPPEDLDMAA